MNFGLEGLIPAALYTAMIAAVLASIFWRPIVGIYFFVPLIPLQTVRYRLNDLPLGASMVYILLAGVAIGLMRQRRWIAPATPWTLLLVVYSLFTFVSMCLGSMNLGLAAPWAMADLRLSNWCDYMSMPILLLLTAAAVTERKQIRWLVVLICLSGLLLDKSFWGTVSGRDFSSFSDEMREGGTMGYAGSNGLAAFEAQFSTFLMGMACFEKRWRPRLAYVSLVAFSALCCMYALSRGGYVAFLAGFLFIGIAKQRILLLLLAVFAVTWASVVPGAVVARVNMTYDENGELEDSAQVRVRLWEDAVTLIQANPVIGSGYDTYRFMNRVREYQDTHNIYLKILVETGFVGLALFVWLLGMSFWRGFLLFRRAADPFSRGLGLGFAGWVLCAAAASAFGDRWTYLQIQGFFWVLAALVSGSWNLHRDAQDVGKTIQAPCEPALV
jgi:O-antigen ligase